MNILLTLFFITRRQDNVKIGKSLTATIQSPLGFATMGLAAALGLATATPLTDLDQYINSNLGFRHLEICFLYSE